MPLFDQAFFQKPGVNEFLLQTGLGLMAAGQPMPLGQNRFQVAAQGLQSGITSRNQAEQIAQLEGFRKAQTAEMERKAAEDQRKSVVQSRFANSLRGMGTGDAAGPRAGLMGQNPQGGLMADLVEIGQGDAVASALLRPPAETQRPFAVAPGSRVFDPVTRQEIFSAPANESDKRTPQMLNAEAMGLRPGTPQYNAYLRSTTDRGTTSYAPVEILDPKSPTGRRYATRDEAFGQPAPTSGFEMYYDDQGRPAFRMGGGTGSLEKSAKAEQEKSYLAMSDQLQMTQNTRASYQPRFATLGGKWDNLSNATKESLGFELSPQEKRDLEDFTAFRADNGESFAKTMKEMSGAAVTTSEAPRQEIYLPKTGTGIFDGDSPTQFEAKLNRQEAYLSAAMWRKKNLLDKGIDLKTASTNAPLYARNPKSGEKLWLHDYVSKAQAANPNAPIDQILDNWAKNYQRLSVNG